MQKGAVFAEISGDLLYKHFKETEELRYLSAMEQTNRRLISGLLIEFESTYKASDKEKP